MMYLIHLGYLGYDQDAQTAFIPNEEIRQELTAATRRNTKNISVSLRNYNRNLLGGLYRENPVKSRNYEAVKSSKKWENVGNSYIIPALLLYRYSYI